MASDLRPSNVQAGNITGLLMIFGYIALYMVLAVAMINTSCSIMYIIPDAILQFMGGQSSSLGFAKDLSGNAEKSGLAGAGMANSSGLKDLIRKEKKDKAKMDEPKSGAGGGGPPVGP